MTNNSREHELDLYALLAGYEDGRQLFDEERMRWLSHVLQVDDGRTYFSDLFGASFIGAAIDNGHHQYLRDWVKSLRKPEYEQPEYEHSLIWPEISLLAAIVTDDANLMREAVSVVARIGPYRRGSARTMLEALVRCGLYGDYSLTTKPSDAWDITGYQEPLLHTAIPQAAGIKSKALIISNVLGMPAPVAVRAREILDGDRRPDGARAGRRGQRLTIADFEGAKDFEVLRSAADWFCANSAQLSAPDSWHVTKSSQLADGLAARRPGLRRRLRQIFQEVEHGHATRPKRKPEKFTNDCSWDQQKHPSMIWHSHPDNRRITGMPNGSVGPSTETTVSWKRITGNALGLRTPGPDVLADAAKQAEQSGGLLPPVLAVWLAGELAVCEHPDREELLDHAVRSLRAEAEHQETSDGDGIATVLRAICIAIDNSREDAVDRVKNGLGDIRSSHPNATAAVRRSAAMDRDRVLTDIVTVAIADRESAETAVRELAQHDGRWELAIYGARLLETEPCVTLTAEDERALVRAQYPMGLMLRVVRKDSISDEAAIRLTYPEDVSRVSFGYPPYHLKARVRDMLRKWLASPPEHVAQKISTLAMCVRESESLNESMRVSPTPGRRDGNGFVPETSKKPLVSVADAVALACDLMEIEAPEWAQPLEDDPNQSTSGSPSTPREMSQADAA